MPQLETLVAQATPTAGPTGVPDISAPGRSIVGALEKLTGVTEALFEADYASKTRRSSASAESELYDLAEEMNNSTDYENSEAEFEKRAAEIATRNREGVRGGFYQETYDASVGGFAERMRHSVGAAARVKRIDASKASLDEESELRAGLYAKMWDDPDARDAQAVEFNRSIEIQRGSGLISDQEAVNYQQGFESRAASLSSAAARQSEIHSRVLEITASTEDKAEALKLADQSDPAIAQDVFRRVKSRFDARETGQKNAERLVVDQGYPAIQDAFTRGVRIGPGEHDVVPPGPEAAYYQLDLLDPPAHIRTKFEAHIAAMSKRTDVVDEDVFAREWDRLTNLRDQKPQEFADEDLEVVRLQYPNYRAQVDQLIADRKDIREGFEPTSTETKRANQLYSEMFDVPLLEGGGAKRPKDKARLEQFKLAYELAYQQQTKLLGGKRLDREQERKLAAELLTPLIVGEETYKFELPPGVGGTMRAFERRPAPGQPPPARVPPRPEQAAPYTEVNDNPDLALRAEVDLFERTGKAATEAEIVAEMNHIRGAARE